MTGTADRETGAERERRSGRGRLSSLDLLPEEAHDDLQWARGELGKRDKTQADILHEFNGRLIDKGLEPVSKSAFNRFSVKHALLTRRLNEAQALFSGLAPRITAEKVDEQTVVLGEFIKLLIFEIVEAEGGAIGSKGAMELARAHLAVIQAQKVSAERRAKLEAEFKADAAKAIDKVATAKGLSPEVKEALRNDLFGIAAPRPTTGAAA